MLIYTGGNLKLIILRHGEAGSKMANPAEDYGRSLTEKGRKEMLQVAKALKSMKLSIDLIAASQLNRALETAEIVEKELGLGKEPEIWEELNPDGERSVLLEHLGNVSMDYTVMLVGHEPCLSSLISEFVSGKKSSRIMLKKAGAAKISVDSISPRPSGRLSWLMTPKLLKKLT